MVNYEPGRWNNQDILYQRKKLVVWVLFVSVVQLFLAHC